MQPKLAVTLSIPHLSTFCAHFIIYLTFEDKLLYLLLCLMYVSLPPHKNSKILKARSCHHSVLELVCRLVKASWARRYPAPCSVTRWQLEMAVVEISKCYKLGLFLVCFYGKQCKLFTSTSLEFG